MNQSFVVYINGKFLNEDQAKVSVLDLGLTRGYGVFDFFRTYNGIPFHLQDHIERFKKSATLIGIPWKEDTKLEKVIKQLMYLNHQKEAAVKFILTGGPTVHSLLCTSHPTFICYTLPLPSYPQELYTKGVKLTLYEHTPHLPECKSLNYLHALLSIQYAKKRDAFESLYVNHTGHILEGSTSNFFAFKNGILVTPKQNILFGITRKVILKLVENIFPVEERKIAKNELSTFDEVFTTSSNKEILSVSQIDDYQYPIGENTKKIIKLFKNYTSNYSELRPIDS